MCLSRILLTLLCVGMLAGCQRGNSPADRGASLGRQAATNPDTTSVVSATEVPAVFIPPIAQLLGHVNPAQDTAFEVLPARMSSRSGLFMRKEASAAFQRMYDAAKEDGLTLTALSATRPFSHQASIWNRKWNRLKPWGWRPSTGP